MSFINKFITDFTSKVVKKSVKKVKCDRANKTLKKLKEQAHLQRTILKDMKESVRRLF